MNEPQSKHREALELLKNRKLTDPVVLIMVVAAAILLYFYLFPTKKAEERIDPELAFHERVKERESRRDVEADEEAIQKRLARYDDELQDSVAIQKAQAERDFLEKKNRELEERLITQQEGFNSRYLHEEKLAKSYYAPIMKAQTSESAAVAAKRVPSSDNDLDQFKPPRPEPARLSQAVPQQAELRAGSWIPAILNNEMHAQVGGNGVATIREDVYDASGKHVLIPKGSRATVQFAKGERSSYHLSALAVRDIILPNGEVRTMPIPVHDSLGKAGLDPRVDGRFKRHYMEKIGMSVLIAAINSIPAFVLDETGDGGGNDLVEYQFLENTSGAVQGILRESLNIPSEKIFHAGAHLNFFLLDSILLPPYDGNGVRRSRQDELREELESLRARATGYEDLQREAERYNDGSKARELMDRMLAETKRLKERAP